eukprot:9199155-Pyramimonas_sp.AAC.1
MYLAIATQPDNPNCVDILENGVDNTIILDTTVTDEEVFWIRNVHNRFHGGQETTLGECYREAMSSQKEWGAYCRQNGIT